MTTKDKIIEEVLEEFKDKFEFPDDLYGTSDNRITWINNEDFEFAVQKALQTQKQKIIAEIEKRFDRELRLQTVGIDTIDKIKELLKTLGKK